MADLDKIKRNVAKMVQQNAHEEDIDGYLSSEGVTVDQVKAHKVGTAAPQPPAQEKPSVLSDVVHSGLAGLGKGYAAVAGTAGDLGRLVNSGMRAVGMDTRDPNKPATFDNGNSVTVPGGELGLGAGATSADVSRQLVGDKGYYKPQTTQGRYAETIASFVPAAAFPGSRLARAARVVVPGAASEYAGEETEGTPLEPWARAGAAVAAGGAPSIARIGLSGANRASAALTGSGFLNPHAEAVRRLSAAFVDDGGLDTALERANSFERSGASAPSVLDLGGGNVRRLVRASAGGGGPAETRALSYADQVRANLQDNVTDRARQLTPGNNVSAVQLGNDLEQQQGRLATEQYREPYAQPASVTPEMVDALSGRPGRAAIGRAYAAAEARRDAQGMAELSDLRDVAAAQSGGTNIATGRFQTLEQALGSLSARSLDRVNIAMREQGNTLAAGGARDIAGGYRDRVTDIRGALDQTPGLTEARDSYRQMQAGRDSLEVGGTILNTPSTDYAGQIADLANRGASGRLGPPNLRPLQVGARQAVTDAVEAPAAGQTGALNRIGSSNRATANLANTFGAERGALFQEAVRNEVSRLRSANFISPETGSQTHTRLVDAADLVGGAGGLKGLVLDVAAKILRGTQLTPQERQAIVELGLSEADVRRFAAQPPRVNRAATGAALITSSQAQHN